MPRTSYETSKRTHQVETDKRSNGKKSFRRRNENNPTWDKVNPLKLAALVCLATTYGASPTFGYTRDGTCLVMGLWFSGERHTDYLSGNEDFEEYFDWVVGELLNVSFEDMQPYGMIATENA
jgi:hypothetical protein